MATNTIGHGVGGRVFACTKMGWRKAPGAAPDQADELALHIDAVWTKYSCFVGWIGGFQCNGIALATETLERCFFIIDERHDNITWVADSRFANDDGIAIQNPGVPHTVTTHPQTK